MVVINKWDLVEDKQTMTTKEYEDQVREQLAPFNDVPIIFTSTITKQRLHKALEKTMEVFENRIQKIPTSELNNFCLSIIERNPPPANKGNTSKLSS